MSTDKFTHLHVHSEYSLLDGAASIKKLVNQTKKLGMETLALTDHGNMFGAAAFFSTAKKADIKPIIGIEAYIAPGNRRDKDSKGISEASNHLILLAKNNQGYKNLLKLSSIGYTEGFYYRPRIDREVLEMYHEGLICTSACLGGEIPAAIAKGDMEKAREVTEYYARLFGEDFFMEIQWHCDDQNVMTPMLVDMANQVGVPLVATNDVHFLEEGDYQAHAALTCISTGKNIDDEKRMKYPPELFLKSPEQMRAMFPKWQEACDNTQVIANRCDVEIDFKTQHAPVFKTPKGKTADQYLEELCLKGLKKQYGELTQEVKDRLYHELKVISSKDFSSYFLIVWDFVNFARRNNIPANPRGSGVGTLVGYALEISYVDPLKYGLLFERFMDPERNEMPDIDIDICQNGRGRVIEYVQEKYGHVAQIITFGTMKARAVLRDVCRVHAVPLPDADKLAKLVPDNLGITLQDALEQEPRIKEWCDKDPKMQEVIDISLRLEGLTRHSSVHACAVVIADEPLTNFLPLYKASGSDDLITQFDGPLVEKVGLLKMDFLGLRTLSVVDRACQLIKEGKGVEIDSRDIDLTDKATLETFCKGRTKGVFQFESGGMKDLLQSMKPDRLEDLIAANALYRPGPMTLIPDYIARKHGESWSVPHPVMEKVLSETYGIMVYQEQVMQILNGLGGLPLARAYRLIKAIGKKKYDVIAAESAAFIDGCVENGIDKAKGKELFELIQKFAGYGFNKSHSTQYAILAFQTAYLKTHYPTEFMAALLTFEMGTVDKVAEYIDECKAYNISVLPPDVNESSTDFNVIYQERQEEETPGKSKKKKTKGSGTKDDALVPVNGEVVKTETPAVQECIRFGMGAVKGVGVKAVEDIIRARQENGRFVTLYDFCQNVDSRAVNKGAIEALIKAGALDGLGANRPTLLAGLEDAIKEGNKLQRDKDMGQMNLFGAFDEEEEEKGVTAKLPELAPWPESLMLQKEKEVLGLYVTSHPLAEFAEKIHYYSTANSSSAKELGANQGVIIGGIISRIRHIVTKKGRGAGARMAMYTLEDLNGTIDGVIFPDAMALYEDSMKVDKMVFIKGSIDMRREEPSIVTDKVYDMRRADEELTHAVSVNLNDDRVQPRFLQQFKSLCKTHFGRCPVYVAVRTDEMQVVIQTASGVRPDEEFCRRLTTLVGKENFKLMRPHDQLG